MLRPITKRGTSGAKTMAKRTAKANVQVEAKVEDKPENILRHMFYAKHNRQIKLSDTDLIGIAEGAPEDANDEWYLTAMSDSEQMALRKVMEQEDKKSGKVSINVLLDKVNSDSKLQEYSAKVVEVKDLPAKAPATIAFRLTRDMDSKALESFAVPFSKEAEGKDGFGRKMEDNERKAFRRWDYYDHQAATGETLKGSWYLDFADGTIAGKAINDLRSKLDINVNHVETCPVVIDGITLDVQSMQQQQRVSLKSTMDQRRGALAMLYRKAMQIVIMMNELNEKYGNQYNDEGKISKIGKVKAEFVLLDPQNPDLGLSPSRAAIRVHSLLQEDVKTKQGDKEIIASFAGYPSGTYKDMLVSEFTNISIEGAIAMAVKAGKVIDGMPNVGYLELITAKRQKVAPTATGDGKGQDQDKAKEKTEVRLTTEILPTIFERFRMWTEVDDGMATWTTKLANMQDKEARKRIAYDMGETLHRLGEMYTKTMQEWHDEVKEEIEVEAKRVLEEKLKSTK